MRTVISEERTTGKGAKHYSAILVDGTWVALSQIDDALYLGRRDGFERYQLEVVDGTFTGKFYRSNSGREEVTATNGTMVVTFESFAHAKAWAQLHHSFTEK